MEIVEESEAQGISFRYDWESWVDGQTRRATQGVDFTCTPHGFRATLSGHARRYGFALRSRIEGNQVTFRFIPRTQVGRPFPRGEGGE